MSNEDSLITVVTFYKFVKIEDKLLLKDQLQNLCAKLDLKGTILLADEGINGTISAYNEKLHEFVESLVADYQFKNIELKYSLALKSAFYRMKVKLKDQIITMGNINVNPRQEAGQYVDAKDWNNLILDPGTIVIDSRNSYEVSIGTFLGSINPKINTFREFPLKLDRIIKNMNKVKKYKKIAMFCTGGIRCEKATSYLINNGIEEVYHLKGGILKYLEEIPIKQSLWNGDCFVFDNRVSVNHNLMQGKYLMCYACRMPLLELDKRSDSYEEGVSCHHCINFKTLKNRKRYIARQKQIVLAKARGEKHIAKNQKKIV